MNDRYLYRAKRTDNGEWVTWNILTGIPHDVSILEDTVCACTGLKDKNGKLIWENDILQSYYYPFNKNKVPQYRLIVNWCDSDYGVGWHVKPYYDIKYNDINPLVPNFIIKYSNEMEKLGNIFDNPELLEVGE